MQIDSFTGRNAFLANWYKCEDLFVEFYDHYGLATWRASTVDHAYGALMAPDYNVAIDIVMAPTAYLASYIAKRRNKVGKAEYRIEVMRKILEDKFSDKALAYRLKSTGYARLINTTVNDTFWGVANGDGKNKLGELLMSIRTQLLALVPPN